MLKTKRAQIERMRRRLAAVLDGVTLRVLATQVVTAMTAPTELGPRWEARVERMEAQGLCRWRYGKLVLTRAGRLALDTSTGQE